MAKVSGTLFEITVLNITNAICPEDVFGIEYKGTSVKEHVLKTYHMLGKVIHPDRNGDSQESKDATSDLNEFKEFADKQIQAGKYGTREALPTRAPVIIAGKYKVIKAVEAGNIADLYLTKDIQVIKSPRNYRDNDLMAAEAKNLARLRTTLQGDWLTTIPEVHETILLDEGGIQKRINVLDFFEGFRTFEDIAQVFQDEKCWIHGRTIAWIWKRILMLVDGIWKSGIIHGSITPAHLMLYPDNDGNTTRDKRKHSIRLVGWANSIDTRTRTKLSIVDSKWKPLYAPEILAKEKLGPTTDLHMAAKAVIFLSGGLNTTRGFNNPLVPPSIQKSLLSYAEEDPKNRPQDPIKHYDQFVKILLKEYGPPSWFDFNIP